MANHKSTKKRIITNEKSRVYNKHYTSQLKTALKAVFNAETKEDAEAKSRLTFKLIDRLVHKNILHKRNGANKKSRISRFVNSLA